MLGWGQLCASWWMSLATSCKRSPTLVSPVPWSGLKPVPLLLQTAQSTAQLANLPLESTSEVHRSQSRGARASDVMRTAQLQRPLQRMARRSWRRRRRACGGGRTRRVRASSSSTTPSLSPRNGCACVQTTDMHVARAVPHARGVSCGRGLQRRTSACACPHAQLSSGKVGLQVNLVRELQEAAAAVRRVCTRAVTVTVDTPLLLPHVFVDGARLAQMLTHLVLRGALHTATGGVTLRAFMDGGDGTMVVVVVSDQGVGLTDARLRVRIGRAALPRSSALKNECVSVMK